MRKLLIALTLFCYCTCVMAMMPVKPNTRYQKYIDEYRDLAIAQMLQWNIPASITLAQGLLESAAGESTLARQSNNHFGIKCHGWTGRTAYADDDEANECFRAYDDIYDSYEDHSRFLATSQRYRPLFSLKRTDYQGWAKGLKSCGYATNPKYAQLLIDIIECYGLDKFDKATSYDKKRIHKGKTSPAPTVITSNTLPAMSHTIRMNNGKFYVIAHRGDTFASLAKEFDSSARKLAKYNERSKKDKIAEGDIIYLQKKKTKAAKVYKKQPHTVRAGESLYSISQMYGVRLKSLYKKNRYAAEHGIKVGDKIIVY